LLHIRDQLNLGVERLLTFCGFLPVIFDDVFLASENQNKNIENLMIILFPGYH